MIGTQGMKIVFPAVASLLYLAVALPLSVLAQEDLRATIRAAILEDTRAASLPSAEVDAIVNALVTRAQAQGVTAQDITWHPTAEIVPAIIEPAPYATAGFFMLVVFFTSMLALATVAAMMEHHKNNPEGVVA